MVRNTLQRTYSKTKVGKRQKKRQEKKTLGENQHTEHGDERGLDFNFDTCHQFGKKKKLLVQAVDSECLGRNQKAF